MQRELRLSVADLGEGFPPIARSTSLAPNMFHKNSASQRRDNKVVINVGGIRYETFKTTLKNIPDTRLSWLTETTAHNPDYDPVAGEYFFDRHPGVFNMILNYYRTGKLHAPSDVCGPLFEDELAFWGIDEKQIEPCCWMSYRTHRDAQETLAEFDGMDFENESDDDGDIAKRFGIVEDAAPERGTWEVWKPKIWNILEDARTSRGAQIFSLVSLGFVLMSILGLCLETVPACRLARPQFPNYTLNEMKDDQVKVMLNKTDVHPALEILEWICGAFFTVEFILRVIFCPNFLQFAKTFLNCVDLISLLPFYIQFINEQIIKSQFDANVNSALQTLKLFRIFRIFKLTRHLSGLKILAHTIKASLKELFLLIVFMFTGVLIYGTTIYFMEQVEEPPQNKFKNIPIGFWWALVTMTTLGYGDIYPMTGLGYVVGVFCAITGVLVIALPVPVIVGNFAMYYSHAQARMKLPKKRRRVLVGAPDALKNHLNSEEMSGSTESFQRDETSIRRKSSSESALDSLDSGIKTASAGTTSSGISVIFTDDLLELPSQPEHPKMIVVSPAEEHHPCASSEEGARTNRLTAIPRRQSLMPNGTLGGGGTNMNRSQSLKTGITRSPRPAATRRRQSLLPSVDVT
ncbi:potassium voltage-gated channel protein Shaw-like [Lineus longissimus]|uniref:potassium voltage-gated channel protein Shaw-like n=1 Tax=Lineus longissimus TaxID=88925 RepID=UPI00315DB0A8